MKKEKSKVQLFVQGSIFLVISNICIKAINFLLLPLYTKNLTPSMLGVSDSITTFTGILLPLLVLGLDSAYSAFYFDAEDHNRDKKVFGTLGISFFFLGIVPIIMCLFANPLSAVIFKSDRYCLEMIVALIGVALNLWSLPFSLEMRLKNKMFFFGIVSIISSLSMVVLNIVFVTIMKIGELSLILSSTIVGAEHFLLYRFLIKERPKKQWFDVTLLKKMFVFALPLIPSVLMSWVLSLSDRYILLYYHGDTSVGLYGIGARFVTFLNVVINAITTAYTTFAFGSKDDEDANEKYYYIFNVVSVCLLFISFTVALFSKEIVAVMTDDAYYSSYIIVRDMMYGQVLYAMSTIVSYGIIFQKKSVYSLLAVSSGAMINLILNLIFIPQYGLTAAALTTLIGYLVCMAVTYCFSEKLYPCKYGMVRVGITFCATYMLSVITIEMNTFIRIGIWVVVVSFCLIIYRDIAKLIIRFVINYIGKKEI